MQQEFKPAGSGYIDTPKYVTQYSGLELPLDSAQALSKGLAWAQAVPELVSTVWVIACQCLCLCLGLV